MVKLIVLRTDPTAVLRHGYVLKIGEQLGKILLERLSGLALVTQS